MTGLLVGTFVIAGVHTALWLPRALKMRRDKTLAERKKDSSTGDNGPDEPDTEDGGGGDAEQS
jgi:hypothetical protein